MTQPSTISLSYFLKNFVGIEYEATSTSGLLIQGESRVDYNDYMGIEFFGGAKLSIDCSDIKYNGTYYSVAPGILLHHGASLNMSPSQSPSCEKNYIDGNYNSITTTDPANPGSSNNYMNYLYLSGGYNYLVPATGTKVLVADSKGYLCFLRSLTENNNKWNTSNTAPVWGTDYQLYNANCSPKRYINISDNAPGYLVCNSGGGSTASISIGGLQTLSDTNNINNVLLQTTDYQNTPLFSADQNSTSYLTAYDGAGDDKEALNRILQILNYVNGNPAISDAQINGLLSIANEAIAGLGKPQNASLFQSSNSEINDLLAFYSLYTQRFNPADSNTYYMWFDLSLSKAHIYHTLGRYDDARFLMYLCYPSKRPHYELQFFLTDQSDYCICSDG